MLGISQLHINDENSRLRIQKLLALAIVSGVKIPKSFEILKSECSHEIQQKNWFNSKDQPKHCYVKSQLEISSSCQKIQI